MSPNKRNLMVGLVVLAGIGVLAWMVLKFANRAATFFLTKGTPIQLVAERADGLSDGSAVYYRGVSVGRVLGVRLGDNEQVVIDAIIEPGAQVPVNVEGLIRTGNLLSASASIFLEPVHQAAVIDPAATAPASAPVRLIQTGDVLRATIPSGSPLLPPSFNDALQEFQERKLIQHVDEAVVTIREQAVKAGKLMDSVNGVVSDEQMRQDLRLAMTNVREVTEKANRIGENLEKVSGDLDGISKQAQDTLTEMNGAVVDVRKTIDKSGQHIDVTAANINGRIEQIGKVLEKFEAIATRVDRGEGTAGKLVTDARLYESMAATAAELNLMVGDLRRLVQQWEQEGISFKMSK
jgi:phospholipid/cholesterol/gamma-HCH transport system substrate-binding protein